MDFDFIYSGINKGSKPLYLVSARLSPRKESDLFEKWTLLLYTLSKGVVDTVVKRLQSEGYSLDDFRVRFVSLAVFRRGVSKGA